MRGRSSLCAAVIVLASAPASSRRAACPSDMVLAAGFCVDRYEASMVDAASGNALSPFYPPEPKQLAQVFQAWQHWASRMGPADARRMPAPEVSSWQRTHDFSPKALSVPGAVPQGYVSYFMAKRACENAGKRLCSEREWSLACRGEAGTRYPYGRSFDRPACNVSHGVHPAHVLHGVSSIGHTDPRLNLVFLAGGKPLLASTGSSDSCASRWGEDRIYDMAGNIDEWVEARVPTFRGGFYARGTTKGCDAQVTNHAASYYDYSIGARCCRDAE